MTNRRNTAWFNWWKELFREQLERKFLLRKIAGPGAKAGLLGKGQNLAGKTRAAQNASGLSCFPPCGMVLYEFSLRTSHAEFASMLPW